MLDQQRQIAYLRNVVQLAHFAGGAFAIVGVLKFCMGKGVSMTTMYSPQLPCVTIGPEQDQHLSAIEDFKHGMDTPPILPANIEFPPDLCDFLVKVLLRLAKEK